MQDAAVSGLCQEFRFKGVQHADWTKQPTEDES
jgi:hypothetical protein